MNLQGERIIPTSVEETWNALNDPETLKACIAGCESIEPTGENQYLAVMAVRIGPVNARFKGRLQLSDIVPMQSYKINFDGQGGVAGFGKGSANVSLAPEGDSGKSTRLNYVADAQVGGKIAQVGSRLVESAAAKISDDFFKAFEARMSASSGASADGATDAGTGSGAGAGSGAGTGSGSGAGAGAGAGAGVGSGGMPDTTARANDTAAATASMPPRPAPTLDHVVGRDTQAQPGAGAAGGGSTIWWIAGIIVLALLFYFFTR